MKTIFALAWIAFCALLVLAGYLASNLAAAWCEIMRRRGR